VPGAGHDAQHGAGDAPPEHLAARGRDDAIVIARHDQRRRGDRRQAIEVSWVSTGLDLGPDIPKTSARSMPRPSSTATASAASCAVV
jgi:hypothetical protein